MLLSAFSFMLCPGGPWTGKGEILASVPCLHPCQDETVGLVALTKSSGILISWIPGVGWIPRHPYQDYSGKRNGEKQDMRRGGKLKE